MGALGWIVHALAHGAFFVASWFALRALRRRGPFWLALGLVAALGLLLWVFLPGLRVGAEGGPAFRGLGMLVLGAVAPLPVPLVARIAYLSFAVVGYLLYVSNDEALLARFLAPQLALLRGELRPGWPRAARAGLLFGVVPIGVGALVLAGLLPRTSAPVEARQAHPSIPYDERFVNPVRTAAGVDPAALARGRHLFAKNCAPCHGAKANGEGVMARALRLRPADFTDVGTITTLVEGYALARVKGGGIGLPAAGAPWDSAMPRWHERGEGRDGFGLSDAEIHEILAAEYDLAGVSPRTPEKIE